MSDLRDELDQLEDKRLAYVMARSRVNSDAQGYKDAGVSKTTFYHLWTAEDREKLHDLAQRVKRETATRALMVLQDAAEEAATVKVGGMRSRDERVKQSAATEVLDRVIGKAASPVEIQGKGGEILKVIIEHANSQDNTTGISQEPAGDN